MGQLMDKWSQNKQVYGFILASSCSSMMYFSPNPAGLTLIQWHIMALTTWLVLMWIFEVYDPAISGLTYLGLVLVLGLSPPKVVLSGFGTPVFMMLFCIYIWIRGFSKTGIEKRVLLLLLSKVKKVNYTLIVLALFVVGIVANLMNPALIFIINVSIALVLGDFLKLIGEKKFSRTAECLFFALMLATYVPSRFILTQPENMVALGFYTQETGETLFYLQWLYYSVANLPLLFAALITTLFIFKPKNPISISPDEIKAELDKMGPVTPLEIRCAILLGIAVLLWVTDMFHHIPPPTVAIVITGAFFLPKLGVLEADDLKGVNWWTPVFMGAAICLGTIMFESGIAHWVATTFEANFGLLTGLPFLYCIAILGALTNVLVTPMGGFAALSTPFFKYAALAGINPAVVPLALGAGFTLWLFPYEMAPILVVYGAGYQKISAVIKRAAVFSIIALIITPLFQYFWLKFIGLM